MCKSTIAQFRCWTFTKRFRSIKQGLGAGSALSVLVGKEGFLIALARALEKHVENQKVEIMLETEDQGKIQVKGPVGEIKVILKEIRK